MLNPQRGKGVNEEQGLCGMGSVKTSGINSMGCVILHIAPLKQWRYL